MYESTINELSTVSITDSKEGPLPGEDSICGIKEIASLSEEVDIKEKYSLIIERTARTVHTADSSTSDASIEEAEPAAPATDVEESAESSGEIETVDEAEIPTDNLPRVTDVIEEHPHNLIVGDVKKDASDKDEGEEVTDGASGGEHTAENYKGEGDEVNEVAYDGKMETDDFVEGIRGVNETNSLIDEGIAPEPAESACVDISSENILIEANEVMHEVSDTSIDAFLPSNVSVEGNNAEESTPDEASDQDAANSNEDCLPEDIFTELDESPSLLKSWQLQKDNNNTAAEQDKPELGDSPPAAPPPADSEPELLRCWSRDADREEGKFARMARKTGVAVTGGVLVIAGLPMIPMPTPGGVVVVGAGLAVLATEFPAAQRALDRSRQGLTDLVGDESDDDEEKKEKKKKNAKIADLVFEDEGAAKKKMTKNRVKHILNPMSGRRGQSTFNNDDFNEMRDKTVNAANGAKKNMKKFVRGTVLPLMERMTSSSRSITSSKSDSTSKHTLRLGSQGVVKPPLFIRTPQITIQEKASNGTGIHEC